MNIDGPSAGDTTFGGLFARSSTPVAPTASSGVSAPPAVPDRVTLAGMTPAMLAVLLERMLSARRRQDPAETVTGERHADGSLHVPSLEAVWLMTRIGKAVGQRRLVNLRHVPISKLRSLNGLAEIALSAVQSLKDTA